MNITKIKVENMFSGSNSPVANQFIISTEEGIYFQSYKSIIAFRANNGKIILDKDYWDYSVTTGKYRNKFLGEGIAETRNKIKEGLYELSTLN